MTRRKREIVGLTNERDFPHLVELALPAGGSRRVFLEFDAFHRERRIPVRRGRSRHEAEQLYIRFCFPDTATADAFRNRFGGADNSYLKRLPRPGGRQAGAGSTRSTAEPRGASEERRPLNYAAGGVSNLSIEILARPSLTQEPPCYHDRIVAKRSR